MRSLLFLLASMIAVSAQVAPTPAPAPAPAMVIEPADADAFREIIETTIPPRYNRAIIQWYTAILQRQQKQAQEKRDVEPDK